MTINELFIVIFFLVQLGIFGAKIYNLMSVGKFSWRFIILSLSFSYIAHLIILTMVLSLQVPEVVLPTNPSQEVVYQVEIPPNQIMTSNIILRLSGIATIMNSFFSVIEVLFKLKDVVEPARKRQKM